MLFYKSIIKHHNLWLVFSPLGGFVLVQLKTRYAISFIGTYVAKFSITVRKLECRSQLFEEKDVAGKLSGIC